GETKPLLVIQQEHDVVTIIEEPRGELWIGSLDGLRKYNIATGTHTFIKEIRSEVTPNEKGVREILKANDGTVWFATHTGLFMYDKRTDVFYSYTNNPRDPGTVSNNRVYSLCQDNSGVLWIGTFGSGISRVNLEQKKFHHYKYSGTSISGQRNNMVMSLLEDSQGKIWVGTWENQLVEFTRETNIWKGYTTSHSTINCLSEDEEGNIWIGNDAALQKFERSTGRIETIFVGPVYNVIMEKNFLWIARLGEICKLNPETGDVSKFLVDSARLLNASNIRFDKSGNIWFSNGNLFFYDLKKHRVTVFQHEPNNIQSISSNSVSSICVGNDGTVWVGTYEAGLNRYEHATNSFKHYLEKDGLPNNVIYGILEDEKGNLWLSTNRGISRFNPPTETFRNFDVDDGLQANEFNRGAYFKSKRGEMFFGGVNGFNEFFPNAIQDNQHIPSVVLTQFLVFNKKKEFQQAIDEVKEITLPFDENFFSFEFSSLDFTNQKKNRFKYMLEGFDHDWVSAGTNRLAFYTDVSPGNYIFRVKGSNNDDVWNEEGLAIAVTIIPPVWATWWFRFLVGIFLAALGPVIYYRRVNALKREKKIQEDFSRQLIESQEGERKRIAAALHDSLGQNIIISKNHAMMGLKVSTEPASVEHLKEISSLLTQSLDEVREIAYNLRPYHLDRIGLTRTIEFIFHKVKSSTTIACLTDVENIDNLLSSEGEISLYRIIQESVNNVVKHSGATRMSIKIQKLPYYLIVEILDNGYDAPRKRKSGTIEKWLDKGKKTYNAVIVKDYHEILKEDCWVL
ncbi:MAG: hypothetical protein HYZ34_09135, partial [Ignavibacteriae bacterium]|nr:hypothetical protein [Ignavibacteriota bacterium]